MAFDCDHCDRTFESRRSELEHVLDEHRDDITSHEKDELKRERNQLPEKDDSGPVNSDLLKSGAGVVLALVLVVGGGYALFATGVMDFSTDAPPGMSPEYFGEYGSTHEHAEFSVMIDGEELDTDQSQYTEQDDIVHIHAGEPGIIHKHGTGVTYGYFLETIGMEVHEDEDGDLCFEMDTGETHCEDEGKLSITLNGEEIEEPDDLNHQEIHGVEQVRNVAAAGGDDLQIEFTGE